MGSSVEQREKQQEQQPVRVLQIVENLDNQAVESWLFKVLGQAQQTSPHIQWTFFCVLGRPGRLDDAVRELGGEVIYSPFELGNKRKFLPALRQVMKQGRYDILHCHHDVMSALPLIASMGLPIKRRIIHVHNTSISLPTPNVRKAALMRGAFRQVCLRADRIVGVSQDALDAMLGGHRVKVTRDKVIHCGIELHRFERDEVGAAELRQSFGFQPDAKILLFVGRMIAYKNPAFVVEMLSHLRQHDSRFTAVFAGTGPKEEEIRELARQKGLQDQVRVLGWRQDVPQLMHACDVLIWPGIEEPKEGLGLGIVEAQAAGLPVLMSRNVPLEAIVVSELVEVLPLDKGAEVWAETAVQLLARARPSRAQALQQVKNSSFTVEQSAENITALYEL